VKLLQLSAEKFLDRVAGPEPTPGGGSAAALAGSLAAALVAMVCGMPKTKGALARERDWLDAAGRTAQEAGARLRSLVDEDAAAYDAVVAAFRLPKASEDEKARRGDAVTAAMRRATEVPLQTAESCLQVLQAAREAADHGNPNARSDAKTGAALAWAGLLGALENVRINAAAASWGGDALRRADALQREAQERARGLELLR
jgi:glutamate formiminotransferase/formiminotetrahydrofolate cyclodeaminase